MREILFRGKRIDNGKWEYGDLMRDNVGGSYVFPNEAENLYLEYEVDPATVGQYSGLTDKNGEKIFEGDIIEDCNNRIGYVAWLPQECGYVVVWEKSDSRLGHRNRGSGYYQDTTISVIGNIHDNPELVKCGKYNE